MTEYRLYCLNEHGHFFNAHEITADCDQEAVARARELKVPVNCELWSRDRLVASLPAPGRELFFPPDERCPVNITTPLKAVT